MGASARLCCWSFMVMSSDGQDFARGEDELRGRFGVDRVTVGAQWSHVAGSPINERLSAGFKQPTISVGADNISPVRQCSRAASTNVIPS
ncbi:hypothetical protein WS62_25965 [Burkholderia sp. ABCPW 14]|nr:hypothetical protein WS62_25965 [Burkholderia sp. ABCPW 14]